MLRDLGKKSDRYFIRTKKKTVSINFVSFYEPAILPIQQIYSAVQ